MLEYNGNAYIRPSGPSNPLHSPHSTKLQQSTASLASSQSETRFSVSKYSFKTGLVTNVYCQKQNQKDYTGFLNKNQSISYSQLGFRRTDSELIVNEVNNSEFRKNYSESLLPYRSRSCNSSIKYWKPISEPIIKTYPTFQHYQHQNNLQKRQSGHNLSKKRQLIQGNSLLKKSISQKKTIYAQRFSQLSSKANFLREEFARQQGKMAKITSFIQKIFE